MNKEGKRRTKRKEGRRETEKEERKNIFSIGFCTSCLYCVLHGNVHQLTVTTHSANVIKITKSKLVYKECKIKTFFLRGNYMRFQRDTSQVHLSLYRKVLVKESFVLTGEYSSVITKKACSLRNWICDAYFMSWISRYVLSFYYTKLREQNLKLLH